MTLITIYFLIKAIGKGKNPVKMLERKYSQIERWHHGKSDMAKVKNFGDKALTK